MDEPIVLYCQYTGYEEYKIHEERMVKFVHRFNVHYKDEKMRPIYLRYESTYESLRAFHHEVLKKMDEEIYRLLPMRARDYYNVYLPVVRRKFFQI